jgi:hypothetical protein
MMRSYAYRDLGLIPLDVVTLVNVNSFVRKLQTLYDNMTIFEAMRGSPQVLGQR